MALNALVLLNETNCLVLLGKQNKNHRNTPKTEHNSAINILYTFTFLFFVRVVEI